MTLNSLPEKLTGRTVRQVAAGIQVHAHDRVARARQCVIRRPHSPATRVRLHIRVVRTEQFLGALDRERLDVVDVLTAAVVALARIAFGVLVGEHRALRRHDPRAGVVF